jgi:hypothetical protein
MYSAPLDPTTFAMSVMVEACDIPPHMTLAQWRDAKRLQVVRGRRRRRRLSVLRGLRTV